MALFDVDPWNISPWNSGGCPDLGTFGTKILPSPTNQIQVPELEEEPDKECGCDEEKLYPGKLVKIEKPQPPALKDENVFSRFEPPRISDYCRRYEFVCKGCGDVARFTAANTLSIVRSGLQRHVDSCLAQTKNKDRHSLIETSPILSLSIELPKPKTCPTLCFKCGTMHPTRGAAIECCGGG